MRVLIIIMVMTIFVLILLMVLVLVLMVLVLMVDKVWQISDFTREMFFKVGKNISRAVKFTDSGKKTLKSLHRQLEILE